MHKSPQRSPKKLSRAQTAGSPLKKSTSTNYIEKTSLSQIKIIEELNQREISYQDKDVEIERLATTCASLNNRVAVMQDMQNTIDTLQKRLSDSERIRDS